MYWCSHIPISAPAGNHTDYYNWKGFYSVVLQGLVDANYRFIDIYVGWPGSVHDARVFAHSSLYNKIMTGNLLPDKTEKLHGVDVPLYMIGDSAYPLQSWLMKPFPHNSALSPGQQQYNHMISSARIVVENSYGRLKGRWRRLMKRNDMHIDNIPMIIAAACVLHNVCEVHGEHFNNAWINASDTSQEFDQQPPTVIHRDGSSQRPKEIRQALVNYFSQ